MKTVSWLALSCWLLAASIAPASERPSQQLSPPAGDTYAFGEGRSRAESVALAATDDGLIFTWPEMSAAWDTALLGITVRANDSTALSPPYVEIAAGTTSDRQYFPAGDIGPRWLNVSFLRGRVDGSQQVRLRARGLEMAPGEATLRLFANGLDLSRSLLVLAPHPDDAEIAAFGVYAWRRATVVTVTTGNAGPPTYEAVLSDRAEMFRLKGRLRLIDSITVPWIGGIPPERTFNLGYFDARLADMHDQPAHVVPEMYGPNTDIGVYLRDNLGSLLPKRSRASTWTNLVDDLERVLKKVRPEVIVAPHPQLDSHRDHQFTTIALWQALARWRTRVSLLLYTNHADQNRYPYGPAGTIMSLPPPVPGGVPIDRIYSHPVTPEQQRLKLFALEAMHDLRVSPSRLYQLVVGDDRTASAESTGPSAIGGVNYLRRAPRTNELFYAYDRETIRPMLEAFLAGWRARSTVVRQPTGGMP